MMEMRQPERLPTPDAQAAAIARALDNPNPPPTLEARIDAVVKYGEPAELVTFLQHLVKRRDSHLHEADAIQERIVGLVDELESHER